MTLEKVTFRMTEETPLMMKSRFKATKTIYDMMHDRGFEGTEIDYEEFTTNFDLETSTIDEVVEEFVKYDFPNLKFTKQDTKETIMVRFFWDKKFNNTVLSKLITEMESAEITHAIAVCRKDSVQSIVKRSVKSLKKKSRTVEFFSFEELQYNVTRHSLVPHHRILNNDDKQALFSRYKIDENNLPHILDTDPVARYYGAQIGDIMEITRKSVTCGKYVTYRVVTANIEQI